MRTALRLNHFRPVAAGRNAAVSNGLLPASLFNPAACVRTCPLNFANKWVSHQGQGPWGRTLTSFSAPSTFQSLRNDTGTVPQTVEDFVLQMSAYFRRKQRIKINDIRAIAEMIEKGAASIGDHGAYLLTAAASYAPDMLDEERIKICTTFWRAIEKEGKLSPESFEALLKCYTDCEYTDYDPLDKLLTFASSLLSNPVAGRVLKPSEKSYYYILLSCCQKGDLESAIKVLDMIKSQGEDMVVNEDYFNALMLGKWRSGGAEDQENVLKLVKESEFDRNPKVNAMLMQILVEKNNSTELAKVYKSAGGIAFPQEIIFKLIRLAVMKKDEIAFNQFLKWIPKLQQGSCNTHASHCIINLIHSGFPREAATILLNCKKSLTVPGVHFGDFLIKELVIANCELELVLDICRQIEDSRLNDVAVSLATGFSLSYRNFNLAYKFFNVLQERQAPIRPHYFWPILLQEANSAGIEGILRTIANMKKFHISPDWDTLIEIILPKMFSHKTDALEVAKILKDSGLSYSSGLLKALLFYLLRKGQLSSASHLSTKIRGTIPQPGRIIDQLLHCILQIEARTEILGQIEHSVPILKLIQSETPSDDKYDHVGKFVIKFCEAVGHGSKDLRKFLMNNLEKSGIKISQSAKEVVEGHGVMCSLEIDPNLTFVSLSRLYQHPKEMDAAALESHVMELKGKDFNPRGTQRLLFMKYCQANDPRKVESLKEEFEASHGELSTGMISSLLGFYIRQKNLDSALETFGKLKEKMKATPMNDEFFQIDLNKVVDLATILVESGRGGAEEAILFLKKETTSFISKKEETRGFASAVHRLLDALHRQGSDEVKEVLDYLLERDLIQASAPVNGVVIRHFLERGKLPTAVALFEEYAIKYKITPLLLQLLYALLAEGNEELLKRVLTSTEKIRGAHEAKHYLAFAKSDMGDVVGAARLFKELGRNRNPRRIENQCDYLAGRNEIKKIVNLLQSLVQTEYDCSRLYMVAFKCCEKTADGEALDTLLQLIQENEGGRTANTFIMKTATELKGKLVKI